MRTVAVPTYYQQRHSAERLRATSRSARKTLKNIVACEYTLHSTRVLASNSFDRKAQAAVLAVEERQSYETLKRDERTSARTLAQLKEKLETQQEKAQRLRSDRDTQTEKRQEVCRAATCKARLSDNTSDSSRNGSTSSRNS